MSFWGEYLTRPGNTGGGSLRCDLDGVFGRWRGGFVGVLGGCCGRCGFEEGSWGEERRWLMESFDFVVVDEDNVAPDLEILNFDARLSLAVAAFFRSLVILGFLGLTALGFVDDVLSSLLVLVNLSLDI